MIFRTWFIIVHFYGRLLLFTAVELALLAWNNQYMLSYRKKAFKNRDQLYSS